MEAEVSFGAWVARRRKGFDLTRAQLAKRVGYSLSALHKIERDERRPSQQLAELLAEHLQIPSEQHPTFLQVARGHLRVERLAAIIPQPATGIEPGHEPPQPARRLPTPPTSLIGREAELATLAQLLRDPQCRLLTLVGPGGIGKTRLALEAACLQWERFADGVFLASLAATSSSEFMVPTVAQAVGLNFAGPTDPRRQLVNYLSNKQVLLLLDNLEHLLDGVDLVIEMLERAPSVKLLATSRERLELQGEWIFEVQGLPVPAEDEVEEVENYSSVRLFLQRAQQARADFELAVEECPEVSRICRLVEGMPLAIELAAAWVPVLSCTEIAEEIERGLDILTTQLRDVPERQRSLNAVFDHTWNLLSDTERSALSGLSVFRGGFTRDAAEQVTGASLPLLSALVAKSLVRRTEAGRYNLHELIRQYVAAQLQFDPEEHTQTHIRYANYYAALLQQWERQLQSPQQPEIVAEMNAEIDNIRLAWGWMVTHQQTANIQKSLRSLWRFHEIRGRFQGGAVLFGQAVEAFQTSGEARAKQGVERLVVFGQVLAQQGYFWTHLGQHEQARELLQQSLALLRPSTDQAALADTLAYLGYLNYRLGELVEADQYAQESLALNRTLNNQVGIIFCLLTLSYIYLAQEAYEQAYTLSSENLVICRDVVGDPHGTADSLITLSTAANHLGRHGEAKQHAEQSLEISQTLNDRWGTGQALRLLGLISLKLGEFEPAKVLLRQSVSQFREIGDRQLMGAALIDLGSVTRTLEGYREAKQHFLEALQIGMEMEAHDITLSALTEIAVLQMHDGAIESGPRPLTHVLTHPASTQEAKDRAEHLRAELESQLTPQQIEMVQATAQAKSFDVVVTELLNGS